MAIHTGKCEISLGEVKFEQLQPCVQSYGDMLEESSGLRKSTVS